MTGKTYSRIVCDNALSCETVFSDRQLKSLFISRVHLETRAKFFQLDSLRPLSANRTVFQEAQALVNSIQDARQAATVVPAARTRMETRFRPEAKVVLGGTQSGESEKACTENADRRGFGSHSFECIDPQSEYKSLISLGHPSSDLTLYPSTDVGEARTTDAITRIRTTTDHNAHTESLCSADCAWDLIQCACCSVSRPKPSLTGKGEDFSGPARGLSALATPESE